MDLFVFELENNANKQTRQFSFFDEMKTQKHKIPKRRHLLKTHLVVVVFRMRKCAMSHTDRTPVVDLVSLSEQHTQWRAEVSLTLAKKQT